jgi:hypothetical protein
MTKCCLHAQVLRGKDSSCAYMRGDNCQEILTSVARALVGVTGVAAAPVVVASVALALIVAAGVTLQNGKMWQAGQQYPVAAKRGYAGGLEASGTRKCAL